MDSPYRMYPELHPHSVGSRMREKILPLSSAQFNILIKGLKKGETDNSDAAKPADGTELFQVLTEGGFGAITTEIREAPEFYYAEDYHQQYLSKNPGGYCGLGGTGISCPVGLKK
ncbi:Mitochondrial peptide methionine sulfoxide reductase [Pitangus sulphuratus]|nr:Mitochondrial peptide methionine sulfoxide reductase [Pitangus sulphuratus]